MRATNRLTDTWLKRAKVPNGIYGDGASLYVRVQGDARSWVFIYNGASGKRREMGLGSYPTVGLALAREKAAEARGLRAKGIDPLEARKRPVEAPTFAAVAEMFVRTHYTGPLAQRYRGYLANRLQGLGAGRVDAVITGMVVDALRPCWGTPTGQYLRSFIERVIDYAVVSGFRPEGANPARYRGHIELLLPKTRGIGGKGARKHHASMSWRDVPDFYEGLGDALAGGRGVGVERTVAVQALKLMVLCGLRQSEARGLLWSDVRGDRIVIPAERYKTRKEHVVPLSEPARAIIEGMKQEGMKQEGELVFPGRIRNRPLSSHAFDALILKGATAHGFRTSLAMWGVESGGFADDLMQRCLGHVVGSEVTRAYQRSDFFEARKQVHESWSAFIQKA